MYIYTSTYYIHVHIYMYTHTCTCTLLGYYLHVTGNHLKLIIYYIKYEIDPTTFNKINLK